MVLSRRSGLFRRCRKNLPSCRSISLISEMDRQLGKFFRHLRNNPDLRDNTIDVLCSDNGAPAEGGGSAGPFRCKKGALYEGGVRSPLIVWAPSMIEPLKNGSL